MTAGFCCNCPESPETVQRDLRELGPTTVLAPPRIWENMLTSVQVRAADATPLKRAVFSRFRRVAEEAEILRSDGKPVPLWLRLQLAVGEFLVYGPIRDQLGLRRARWAYTGGAPLGPDTFRFFRSIGVNLKQVYGSTESSALISIQPDAEANPTSAGRPCPGIEVKIADRGEVLIRSRGIFKGYYKAEEATREVVDGEGWFHTGDAGFLDPRGHLVIIDRAKDVGAMVDGTPFAPQFIENKLKFSPYIREAVAFGNEKPFVAAMIAIDLNTVGNWAERRGIPYTSYMDLTQKPESPGADPGGDRQGQRDPARQHQDPALPAPDQGPGGGRRGDDPHPEGAAALRGREVRGYHRRLLLGRRGGRAEHPDHLRGRPAGQHPVPGAHRGRGGGSAQPCLISTGRSSRC